jgi:adenylate kinase family enzyme
MIVGAPGSGKSTLARALGARTGLPVHHVDLIHWLPGWRERPLPEKVAMARAVEAGGRWIFEGGLSATWPERASRADLILWLDLPLPLRLWRATVLRRWRYALGERRPDLPPDCPERFDPAFVRYIVASRRRNRAKMAALAAGPGAGRTMRLASPRAVANFLALVPDAPQLASKPVATRFEAR